MCFTVRQLQHSSLHMPTLSTSYTCLSACRIAISAMFGKVLYHAILISTCLPKAKSMSLPLADFKKLLKAEATIPHVAGWYPHKNHFTWPSRGMLTKELFCLELGVVLSSISTRAEGAKKARKRSTSTRLAPRAPSLVLEIGPSLLIMLIGHDRWVENG